MAAALFAAPLAGAATAYADSHPTTPQQRHAPSGGYGSEEQSCEEHGCEEQHCDKDEKCPDKPALARTGSDHTKEVVLGGAAAALVAAGAGAMLIGRRRSTP